MKKKMTKLSALSATGTISIEEQRALIKRMRLEIGHPELTAQRLREEAEAAKIAAIAAKIEAERPRTAEEQAVIDEANRKFKLTEEKLEQWRLMKVLKGEWDHEVKFDMDKVAKRVSEGIINKTKFRSKKNARL